MEAEFLRCLTPRRVIALALRFGPYGAGLHPLRKGLSIRMLERAGRTIDLGPLQPGQLPRRLFNGKRILLAPEPMLADLKRVDVRFGWTSAAEGLVLIGRRQLRDNNSWMHNVPRLMKGRDRCTLWMNRAEAARLGLADGQEVIRSSVGTLQRSTLFWGSLIGLVAELILMGITFALAISNDIFIMSGPDVPGSSPASCRGSWSACVRWRCCSCCSQQWRTSWLGSARC